MNKKREKLEKEYEKAAAKLEQYQHKGQRLENRIKYYPQGTGRSETTALSLVGRRLRVWLRRLGA